MIALSAKPFSGSEPFLPLLAGEIHVWLDDGDSAGDSDTFLRQLLCRYTGGTPQDLLLHRGDHGKPYLLDSPLPLQFSLSHSGGNIACAVTLEVPLGLDLEAYRGGRDVSRLARRFYSPEENAVLAGLDAGERERRFYDLWALKEAWIKSSGAALGSGLETTAFNLDLPSDGTVGTIVKSPQCEDRNNAYLCLLNASPAFALALCCLSPSVAPPRIQLIAASNFGRPQVLPFQTRACSSCSMHQAGNAW